MRGCPITPPNGHSFAMGSLRLGNYVTLEASIVGKSLNAHTCVLMQP